MKQEHVFIRLHYSYFSSKQVFCLKISSASIQKLKDCSAVQAQSFLYIYFGRIYTLCTSLICQVVDRMQQAHSITYFRLLVQTLPKACVSVLFNILRFNAFLCWQTLYSKQYIFFPFLLITKVYLDTFIVYMHIIFFFSLSVSFPCIPFFTSQLFEKLMSLSFV